MRTTLGIPHERPDLETPNSPPVEMLDTLPPSLRYGHKINCGLTDSIGPDHIFQRHVWLECLSKTRSNQLHRAPKSVTRTQAGGRLSTLPSLCLSDVLLFFAEETQKRNSAINLAIERVTRRT